MTRLGVVVWLFPIAFFAATAVVVFGPAAGEWITGAGSLSAYERPTARPAKWAQPIHMPGVPSLHRVSAELYRGGQPTAEGVRRLKAMGVRTIVNLRAVHTDRDEIGRTNVAYERIRFNTWRPDDDEVVRFLRIATDPGRTPAFVHCRFGADRTGTMCAAYRAVVQGWSMAEAIRELAFGGFGHHRVWRNLVAYLERLNVPAIRRRAGLSPL